MPATHAPPLRPAPPSPALVARPRGPGAVSARCTPRAAQDQFIPVRADNAASQGLDDYLGPRGYAILPLRRGNRAAPRSRRPDQRRHRPFPRGYRRADHRGPQRQPAPSSSFRR